MVLFQKYICEFNMGFDKISSALLLGVERNFAILQEFLIPGV